MIWTRKDGPAAGGTPTIGRRFSADVEPTPEAVQLLQMQHALDVVLGGLVVVLLLTAGAVARYQSGADAAKVIAAFTGVVGTLVGLVAGHHLGSSGNVQHQGRAERRLEKAYTKLMPEDLKWVLQDD